MEFDLLFEPFEPFGEIRLFLDSLRLFDTVFNTWPDLLLLWEWLLLMNDFLFTDVLDPSWLLGMAISSDGFVLFAWLSSSCLGSVGMRNWLYLLLRCSKLVAEEWFPDPNLFIILAGLLEPLPNATVFLTSLVSFLLTLSFGDLFWPPSCNFDEKQFAFETSVATDCMTLSFLAF